MSGVSDTRFTYDTVVTGILELRRKDADPDRLLVNKEAKDHMTDDNDMVLASGGSFPDSSDSYIGEVSGMDVYVVDGLGPGPRGILLDTSRRSTGGSIMIEP